jgi:hypothetical protein
MQGETLASTLPNATQLGIIPLDRSIRITETTRLRSLLGKEHAHSPFCNKPVNQLAEIALFLAAIINKKHH